MMPASRACVCLSLSCLSINSDFGINPLLAPLALRSSRCTSRCFAQPCPHYKICLRSRSFRGRHTLDAGSPLVQLVLRKRRVVAGSTSRPWLQQCIQRRFDDMNLDLMQQAKGAGEMLPFEEASAEETALEVRQRRIAMNRLVHCRPIWNGHHPHQILGQRSGRGKQCP